MSADREAEDMLGPPYPSKHPAPILDRLDLDAHGVVVHYSHYRRDTLDAAYVIRRQAKEIERLSAEVASLRLTLGGKTFSATVPEPIGCPLPGMCSTVAEIGRLRSIIRVNGLRAGKTHAEIDEVINGERQQTHTAVETKADDCCHRTRVRGAPCPAGRACPHDSNVSESDMNN